VCGAQTVTRIRVDCPELRDIWRKLRSEVGDTLRSVSSLLGGSIEYRKGKPDIASRARTVQAVLDFAGRHSGFGVVRYEGSLTMGTGIRPREALMYTYTDIFSSRILHIALQVETLD
jgi:hypothetical protein